MQDTNVYTLYWPGQGAAAADLSAAGVTLTAVPAAFEGNFLIIEPSDLLEVGVLVTTATDAAPFAFTVTKTQSTAAATDLATPLCVVTGPGTIIPIDTCLRRYKTLAAATAPPASVALPANTGAATGIPQQFGPSYDLWHFDRGDVLVITVTVTAGAGAGIFFARFQRTGAARINRKPVITPVGLPITTVTDTLVDMESTT